MSTRLLAAFSCFLLSSFLVSAKPEDPVKEKIAKAKKDYKDELAKLRGDVKNWFERREENARTKGDKKLVDEIKLDRTAYDKLEVWPADVPSDLNSRYLRVRKQYESVLTASIKEYLKAKKDNEATDVETELVTFRKEYWPNLDLTDAEIKDGFFRVPPDVSIPTSKSYRNGFEMTLVARTESDSIRLHAHRQARVIFNWEDRKSELRVHDPSDQISRAKFTPLKPNTFYTLKWKMTPDGIWIYVNNQLVFSEKKNLDLDVETKFKIQAEKSYIDVKEFKLIPISK